jgi:hypothetical protein
MRYLTLGIFMAVVVSACQNKEKELQSLLQTSQSVTDSLSTVIQEEYGKREKLAKDLEELDTYSQGLGVSLSAENDPEKKKPIGDRIKEAVGTMKSQKETIQKLSVKVSSLQKKLAAVTAENDRLKGQLATLGKENIDLKNKIASLEREAAGLKSQLDSTSQTVISQQTKLSTGYYVMGGTGFLRDKKILERRGPFGNAYNPRFDPKGKEYVKQIDIVQTTEIEVPTTKDNVILWSPHIPSSYEVIPKPADATKSILRIKNPDEFWQTAKVLAIGTEG